MKHVFIINPAAGKKKSTRQLEESIRTLGVDCEIVFTQKTGDARRIAREAAERGEDVRIYACGGDGTLNEVVNGAAGFDNAAITNVPTGTGNDFLKIFGGDYKTRFFDLKALSAGPQAAMDLIDCNGHLGIDIVFKGIAVPTVVDCGDLQYEGETTIVCVCSGRYYGGGFMPVGDNMPDDGVLETLVVRKVSRFTFFRLVGQYAKGRYREFPDLIWHRRGDGVTVRSDRELVAVVDGEPVRGKKLEIRLSKKKVNFFYPEGCGYSMK